MMTDIRNMPVKTKWPLIFFLWVFHGLIAFWQFTTNTAFRPAPFYLLFAFFLLVWIVLNAVLAVSEVTHHPRRFSWKSIFENSKVRDVVLIPAALLVLGRVGLWYVHGLLNQELALQVGGYLDILAPILDLIAWASLEMAILIVLINLGHIERNGIPSRKFLVRFLMILSVLAMTVLLISQTGLGIISSYKSDWQRGLPAVPLIEWQIILALLFCMGMFVWERKIKISNSQLDFLACVVIWVAASVIWLGQPVIPNPSALAPHEPNFEIYPFIDAQTYDVAAQSILIGDGFGADQIPQRPLYLVFLALLHMLVGRDYHHVIFVQSLVFAFFPVLLFLLGRDLFGRPIGIAIALLAILRDYTSNIVSPFTGNLSYSKVYLSEIPTAMLLILFLILGIRWIRSGFPLYMGMLLGGVLGLAMLIRTQTVVLVPVIMFFSILSQMGKMRSMAKSTVVMLLTAMMVVSPWLWRNWKITGDLIFDNPESQTMNLALRYSRVNGVDRQVVRLPGETSAEFSTRLKDIAVDAILSNPSGAALALTNSFLNHGVNNILLFPLRNEIKSFDELLLPSDAFWERWEGTPTRSQAILLGFYIFLFALGVTAAWQSSGWLGLLPLGLNLIYNLWTSIALLSGQRFMLAMDWSIYFYYMIGLFALAGAFLFFLNGTHDRIAKWMKNNPPVFPVPSGEAGWNKFILAAALFAGAGLSLPLMEHAFPERYPHLPQGELVAMLAESSSLENSIVNPACFRRLVSGERLSIQQGMALYPRYYRAGDGEDFTDTPGYKRSDAGRLVFDLIGQQNQRVIFPMQESPAFFPHASDVSLIYKDNQDLWFIFVRSGQEEGFHVSDEFDRSLCN
jgi:hypothetical protein